MIDLREELCSTFVLDSYRWVILDEYGDIFFTL
jgi:hypothetical protein